MNPKSGRCPQNRLIRLDRRGTNRRRSARPHLRHTVSIFRKRRQQGRGIDPKAAALCGGGQRRRRRAGSGGVSCGEGFQGGVEGYGVLLLCFTADAPARLAEASVGQEGGWGGQQKEVVVALCSPPRGVAEVHVFREGGGSGDREGVGGQEVDLKRRCGGVSMIIPGEAGPII